jgi:hypothetical protein
MTSSPRCPARRGQDHLHHVGQAVLGEEHVLGPAEADARAPKAKATLASRGMSALARTPSRRISSAQDSSRSNFL